MATIAREKNGTVRIWFVDAGGKRKGVRIGKASEEYAELFKGKLEDLVTATITNTSPRPELAHRTTHLF